MPTPAEIAAAVLTVYSTMLGEFEAAAIKRRYERQIRQLFGFEALDHFEKPEYGPAAPPRKGGRSWKPAKR